MTAYDPSADRYLDAVKKFADRVLDRGRDVYGKHPTPLFVDGLRFDTLEPLRSPVGEPPDMRDRIVSNLSRQQIFFRILSALSALTGEETYKEKAIEASRFALKHLRRRGLIFWGGHAAWDLETSEPAYVPGKGAQHELKCVFPFYELMWEADAAETRRFIEAFWNAHIREWLNLEFNRHASLAEGAREISSDPWENVYKSGPVFFVGEGLTFVNTGTDLVYAAALLSRLGGYPRPLVWAKRLAYRYVETRNVKTGLGGYSFSISQLPGGRGDRAVDQLGDRLPTHYVMEPILVSCRQNRTMLCSADVCKMALGETLGDAGRELARWAIEDLLAFGRHAYDEADNAIHPMLTDGFRLTGLVPTKDGYFGPAGQPFRPVAADAAYFWTYSLGYRISGGDPFLWRIARSAASHNGLGEIGRTPRDRPEMNRSTATSDPNALFASLELHKATANPAFLEFARRVGDNILDGCRREDFFVSGERTSQIRLDSIEAFSLLHLYAALRDKANAVPAHYGGAGAFGGTHPHGKPIDREIKSFDENDD